MDWKDIASKVGTVAPILGTLLGGPAGAAVGGLVASALGTGANPGEVAAAMTGNSDAIVKLRELETQQQTRFQELLADQAKATLQAEVGDRDSARKMQETTRSQMPAVLAMVVTVGFFGILAALLMNGLPKDGGEVLMLLVGSLASAWTGVLSFYFGTTFSSSVKTELLTKR